MHRLAQVVTGGGKKARLGLVGDIQVARAFGDAPLKVRIDLTQLCGHCVELRGESSSSSPLVTSMR